MAKPRAIVTDDFGARALSSLIQSVHSDTSGGGTSRVLSNNGAVVVEIQTNIAANNRQLHSAVLQRLNGNDWVSTGQTVQIRNLSETPLERGFITAVVPVSNLGLSVLIPRRLQVIMAADLFAAVRVLNDPSTAAAYILRPKANGDLKRTSATITIVNRFLNISVDDGTYAKAEWIDGEWQLYAADCPGGSSDDASGLPTMSSSEEAPP